MTDSTPFPVKPGALCKCGATERSVEDAGRCRRGHVLVGNRAALTHGAYAQRATPPRDLRDDVADFATQLHIDQGGSDQSAVRSGYVRRLAELETLCQILGRDLAERGVFTPRGRTRATFHAFVSAVSAWDRIANRLGLDRRMKDVLDGDAATYLARVEATRDGSTPDA